MGDDCSPNDNIYPSTITSLLITYSDYNSSNSLVTFNALQHQNTTIYLLAGNNNEVSANLTLRTASESDKNNTNLGVTNYSTTMGYPSWSYCLPSDTANGTPPTLTPNETITVNGTGLECGAPCNPHDYDFVKPVGFHSALSEVQFTVVILMNLSAPHTTSTTTSSSVSATSSVTSTTTSSAASVTTSTVTSTATVTATVTQSDTNVSSSSSLTTESAPEFPANLLPLLLVGVMVTIVVLQSFYKRDSRVFAKP